MVKPLSQLVNQLNFLSRRIGLLQMRLASVLLWLRTRFGRARAAESCAELVGCLEPERSEREMAVDQTPISD